MLEYIKNIILFFNEFEKDYPKYWKYSSARTRARKGIHTESKKEYFERWRNKFIKEAIRINQIIQ